MGSESLYSGHGTPILQVVSPVIMRISSDVGMALKSPQTMGGKLAVPSAKLSKKTGKNGNGQN